MTQFGGKGGSPLTFADFTVRGAISRCLVLAFRTRCISGGGSIARVVTAVARSISGVVRSGIVKTWRSNYRTRLDAAMMLLLHIVHHWHRTSERGR